jgi:glycosyltransferase-like protein LARGE
MMLDVDFAVCTEFRGRFKHGLKTESEFRDLAKGGGAAFVVPAFEYIAQEDGKDWKNFPRSKQVRRYTEI